MTQLPAALVGNKGENTTSNLSCFTIPQFFCLAQAFFFFLSFFLAFVHKHSLQVKTHQFPPLLWNSADIHRMTLHHVEKTGLWDSDGTDYMDPPGKNSEATNQSLPLFELNTQEGS